jgi:uncharacterized protein (TIGR02391 family)
MLQWYVKMNKLLREMRRKAEEASVFLEAGNPDAAAVAHRYLKADYARLKEEWIARGQNHNDFGTLGRHVGFGEVHDYKDILNRDLPAAEALVEKHALESADQVGTVGFEALLHPVINEKALPFYVDEHYREAVLNSVIAVFDFIRQRTGLTQDGAALASEALSMDRPRLILSELDSESGRNDQKGFMQIIQGMYLGIRNPKAHSLVHDLDQRKAAQYMVFASLVMRRVDEAKAP